jgi:hypothetical protein
MNCPICGKIEALEEDYDICETCGWEADPFMSTKDRNIQFIDCTGNKISAPENTGLGTSIGSPNHCDSIADARLAWSKYKTWGHFYKDKAPESWALARHEAIKKHGFEDDSGSSPDNPKTFTKKETDQIFKKIFGKNFKERK